MFGALNRFISRLDSDPQENWSGASGNYGFQVLRNTKADLALEPWFDFIIGINGRNIDNPSPDLFATEIRNCAGAIVSLGVWSAKGQRLKELYVSVSSESPSLGLSLQWAHISTTEDVWHILDVIPNSPADFAGLLPYGDYVIGSPEGIVRGENGLGELVEDFLNRPLRLYVYNHEYDVARPITITPSRTWGGTGALGCVLGFGALHRIPAPLEEPPNAPGETLFENNDSTTSDGVLRTAKAPGASTPGMPPQRNQMIVPADIPFDKPVASVPSNPPRDGRRLRSHHGTTKAGTMDEYFKEGEEKSKEDDGTVTKQKADTLPPPPKGGPPKAVASPVANTTDDAS